MSYNRADNLNKARAQQDDEFYTPYDIVKQELDNYEPYLRNKNIICPCECPNELLEILPTQKEQVRNKGLLGTVGYIYKVILSDIKDTELEKTETLTGNFIKYLLLNRNRFNYNSLSFSGMVAGEGLDFRSINYYNYDVVITNPPFTLMDDFINIIVTEYNKDLIVISSQVAVTLRNITPLILNNKLRYGFTRRLNSLYYSKYNRVVKASEAEGNTAACCSFMTTFPIPEVAPLKLEDRDLKSYPTLNGYLYIEKTKLIPNNYSEPMIVPITFLLKYNRQQFKLLDILQGLRGDNGEQLFQKALIQRI